MICVSRASKYHSNWKGVEVAMQQVNDHVSFGAPRKLFLAKSLFWMFEFSYEEVLLVCVISEDV